MSNLKPKQFKKDRLLDQGVNLLLEKGYHATGLKEILDTVQIPRVRFTLILRARNVLLLKPFITILSLSFYV